MYKRQIPSVAMSGLRPIFPIKYPLNKPHSSATPRAMSAASQILTPKKIYSAPAVTIDSPITEPTERSIPPITRTIVIPLAIIPSADSPSAVVERFALVRKYGEMILRITAVSYTHLSIKISAQPSSTWIISMMFISFVTFFAIDFYLFPSIINYCFFIDL